MTAQEPPKTWKVQYWTGSSWVGWGLRDIPSSNEAYRRMKKRIADFNKPPSEYRVVPDSTPDGPEPDRGHYRVQVWNKYSKEWATFGHAYNHYATVSDASAWIGNAKHDNTYRVKWFPGKRPDYQSQPNVGII